MGVWWGREERDKGGEREAPKKKKTFNSLYEDIASHLLGFSYAAQPFSVPLVYRACVTWHYTWVSYWITH